MKDLTVFGPESTPFSRSLCPSVLFTLGALTSLCILPTARSLAGNLLLNPGFETPPSGQTIAASWTYFAPPTLSVSVHDYWVADQTHGNGMPPHSGTFFWKEWFALNSTNNVAGIYQTFSSAPGSVYQASGWMASASSDNGGLGSGCATWLQVEFLGASSNLLALYKTSQFSSSVGLDTWFPFSVTNACDVNQPVSTGDPFFTTYAVTGSVSQLVAPAGTASVRYRYCYLAVNGAIGSAVLDDTVLNQVSGVVPPVITALFPQDTMIFVNPNSGLSFNVSSPSGFTINNSGIHMTVNGANVSGSLVINGSASSKSVSYSGLQSNTAYTVAISVTDVSNLTVNASVKFQTMWLGLVAPTYVWEAEDWDFTNGMYIDFPNLCNASGDPNCYFDKTGVQDVDEHNSTGASGPYRPADLMGTAAAGDGLRPALFYSNRVDYCINPFNGGEWVNYTRDWPPSGTFWVIGRVAVGDGFSGSLALGKVNPDTSTTQIGTISLPAGLGWTTFTNLYLLDDVGNKALMTVNGKATLRLTSGGNILPNFFMLVPAQVDLPQLSNVYPTGTHPFEYTNAFTFTVTTIGSTFPASGITLIIDGNDVTSKLQIAGTSSSNRVVYPTLLPNAIHTAVITATNALGHGIRVTSSFDTFNEANYMVEAEDFDFNGGQYIDPWSPDAYQNQGATTNIDFQHTTLDSEQFFNYRTDGIPQDKLGTHDYLRQVFQPFGIDYVLTFFAGNDWVNYTRAYPAGSYYAYGRFSGGGPFSMYLDQVVSGATTTTQVTKRLGQWSAVGQDYNTFAWVPLTDSGQVAPVAIKLNGLSTLRITTDGFCNPNFFMLVPANGISLTATQSGNNIVISFPTQMGATYRVFYRTDLGTGNWVLLTSALGNGSVKSVTDATTGTRRFYKVVGP